MTPWRVISVFVLPNAQLEVTFVDGTSGKVDMRRFLSGPNVDGTGGADDLRRRKI